jgi:O-antigen ligase
MDAASSNGQIPFRHTAGERAPAQVAGSRLGLIMLVIMLCALAGGAAVAMADVNGLVLCLTVAAGLLVLLDFRVGVVLLIVMMPIGASQVFPRSMLGVTGLNPVNVLIAVTLASFLLRGHLPGGLARLMPRPLVWMYLVPFLVAGVLGTRHVDEILPVFIDTQIFKMDMTIYVRDYVLKPLLIVVFGLLVGAGVARSKDSENFLPALIASIWLIGLMVIGFYIYSGASLQNAAAANTRSFLSPLGLHANDLGRLAATAYALLLFTWASTNRLGLKFALLITMGVVVIALLLTFSRGAFFGFIVVNGLFLISRRNRNAWSLLFIAAGLVLAAMLLPGVFMSRLETGFGVDANAVSAGRIDEIWLPLLPEFLTTPPWGNGIAAILWSDAMRGGFMLPVEHPHNAYLRVLLDMGIIGLVLVCGYFFTVWRGFRQLSADPALSPTMRGFYDGAGAGLLSFLIAGFAGSGLMPTVEQMFLWIAIGMMYGERARRMTA